MQAHHTGDIGNYGKPCMLHCLVAAEKEKSRHPAAQQTGRFYGTNVEPDVPIKNAVVLPTFHGLFHRIDPE